MALFLLHFGLIFWRLSNLKGKVPFFYPCSEFTQNSLLHLFPESDSKIIERIERIPESFDESRAIVDVSPSAIPPFALTEVRADALFHLKLVAKRAVYIYKLKWKVEGQGEIYSTCMRFPLWSNEMSPVSDKDSYSIKCD